MKIRIGFVSNSSSSSFVVICDPVKFNKIKDAKDIKDIYIVGDYACEGVDFFPLSKDIYNYLNKNQGIISKHSLSFYKVYKTVEEEVRVKKNSLPDEFTIMAIEADYHPPEEIDDFKEKYPREEEEE